MYYVMVEMLEKKGSVTFNPAGKSMLPTIRDKGDKVVIKKIKKIKKYDILLYVRDNGDFVLHRVLKVNPNNTFNMCGDNQHYIEKNVRKGQILGTVIKIYRNNVLISTKNPVYKIYSIFWVFLRPIRHCISYLKNKGL